MQHDLRTIQRTPTAENPDTSPSAVGRRDEGSTISLSSSGLVVRQQEEDRGSTRAASSETEIYLGVIDQYPFTRECISSCLQLLSKNLKVLTFSSVDDCMMAPAIDFDLVLYHIHSGGLGQLALDEALASLKPTFQSVPVIILSDLDPNEWMLEAMESGARGYIPTGSTSVAVAVEIIRMVRAGGTFVPPSSLRMIKHTPSSPELRLEEPLTSRQLSVLQYLTQGKSNKIIAYELKMSESTVKVHVRNIMKKMRASNRTEVAFRARNLWSAERQRLVVSAQATGSNGGAS